MSLRADLKKLANDNPELRKHLVPLLAGSAPGRNQLARLVRFCQDIQDKIQSIQRGRSFDVDTDLDEAYSNAQRLADMLKLIVTSR